MTQWQAFLSAQGAHIDNDGVVSDFGDPAGELAAATDATVMTPLTHLALLSCSGDDATSFLQNQLTSDVNHLAETSAQYSSWCTHKGRMQASFLLFRQSGTYKALLAKDILEATQKRLQVFVLRSKVKLTDLSGTEDALGIAGSQARDALTSAGLPVPEGVMETASSAAGSVICLGPERFLIVAPTAGLPAIFDALKVRARPTGVPVWQWLDTQAGIVFITAATKEEFVPQMVNFDKIGAVSFRKGCYPGQEVVARTHYLGKIKRHLYRLQIDAKVDAGSSIFHENSAESACGTIASIAPSPAGGFIALAVIKESEVDAEGIRIAIPGVRVLGIEPVQA
ncbi:folate-binding protein [uncultured Propionivibrio sp.]|uniref:CAF17-like 4Fe-4S cluster assembly/insertion protein YgfZ n=1 Tax=uncultured Propionivibrio sp. TaxID=426737 RepID=UPI0029C044DD|nr:folate-binding protein [uncultured Propionivibrio sp.]